MMKTSRISEINRNVCSFSLYEDCTIFFPSVSVKYEGIFSN